MLVGIATILGFGLSSIDVTQAYIQSEESMTRDISIKPPNEFKVGLDELIKLLKPLYGLVESDNAWVEQYDIIENKVKKLGMQ